MQDSEERCAVCNATDDTYVSYCYTCDHTRTKSLKKDVACPECEICSLTETAEGWYCSNCDHTKYKLPRTLDPKGITGALKPQLQLIPPAFNIEVAKALKGGGIKHGPWNWRDNQVEIMTYLGAMKRHIDQVIDREDVSDIDVEMQCHHLGCVAAGCAIVLDAMKQGTLVDNRPKGKNQG